MFDVKNYYDIENLDEALNLLGKKPHLTVIAGGTDVLIKMQHGWDKEETELLGINRIAELKEIRILDNGDIEIGALCNFSQIEEDTMLQEYLKPLVEAAASMGGPQIRNVATIGGNICNGVTSADSASTLFAYDVRLKLRSERGERIVSINEFYQGPGKVVLETGELLTHILIPKEAYEGYKGRYIKFARRKAMDIATLGVSVNCRIDDNSGRFENIRIGLGVAGPTPLRCLDAEAYAKGLSTTKSSIAEIASKAVLSSHARTSWRASKEYREHLIEELVAEALLSITGKVRGEEYE